VAKRKSCSNINWESMTESNNKGSFAARFAPKSQAPKAPAEQKSESSSMVDKYAKKENKTMEALSQQTSNTTSSQADLIYLVKGIDNGRNAWYYVMVERLKLSLFQKALNDDIIHLENYGVILNSAYGDEPPAEVTDELKKKYGIN
jgi:hypothetical protein